MYNVQKAKACGGFFEAAKLVMVRSYLQLTWANSQVTVKSSNTLGKQAVSKSGLVFPSFAGGFVFRIGLIFDFFQTNGILHQNLYMRCR